MNGRPFCIVMNHDLDYIMTRGELEFGEPKTLQDIVVMYKKYTHLKEALQWSGEELVNIP